MKVFIVQGEHPYVPGRPMLVCATKEAADREASELVTLLCRGYDIPGPDAADHWNEALIDVQDRIIQENEIELDDPDDMVERARKTEADVWVDEYVVLT